MKYRTINYAKGMTIHAKLVVLPQRGWYRQKPWQCHVTGFCFWV